MLNLSEYSTLPLQPFGICIMPIAVNTKLSLSRDIILYLVRAHKIVLFRGFNSFSKIEFRQYANTLGQLLEWEFGAVMEMKVSENPKNYLFTEAHVPFHWDGAFHKEPQYLLFNCIEPPLPNSGGETLFADTESICKTLALDQQMFWGKLTLKYKTEKIVHYGGNIEVPLIQQHPDKAVPILRFAEPVAKDLLNPVEVSVVGFDRRTSDELISNLAARCYDQQFCYVHRWQDDDLLLADNFSLLHARNAFAKISPRHLRRIQILN
jgi:alpha-ketoglutarate-dependent taurine dioxygenase